MSDLLKISFEEKAERDDINFITDSLDKFNCSRAGCDDDFEPLNCFLRDADNLLVGGILGTTFWQWLHIDIFWIEEKYRNQGYGEKLLLAGEQKAIERGCLFAYLDTFEFQAPKFYLKLGYEVFGQLPNFTKGYSRYFLKKNLK